MARHKTHNPKKRTYKAGGKQITVLKAKGIETATIPPDLEDDVDEVIEKIESYYWSTPDVDRAVTRHFWNMIISRLQTQQDALDADERAENNE